MDTDPDPSSILALVRESLALCRQDCARDPERCPVRHWAKELKVEHFCRREAA
ncbi:MAG: hypothetical protein ACPLRW_05605 [Moorellales bacterium]